MLKEISEKTNTPMSRLCAIAVDNELDCEPPFNYPTEIPEEYKEYLYAGEAAKIMDVLSKSPTGIALDTMVLMRRDMGIPSRDDLLGGVKELLEKDKIEFYKPTRSSFSYGQSYRRMRLKGGVIKNFKNRKFKRIEGVSTKYERILNDDEIERE